MRKPLPVSIAALLILPMPAAGLAGEIAGLPSNLPPDADIPLEVSFSNDFLGRGGSVDDFRTQQLIVSTPIGDGWLLTADHSILTLTDPDAPGRIDQLALTAGIRFFERNTRTILDRVVIGIGLRSSGNYAGERMQNGFHRLTGSELEFLPYTDKRDTDFTLHVDANRYHALHETGADNPWRFGYWLRGSALITSDGQVDAAAGAYAVARRASLDGWFGLRYDARSGYDDPVFAATADAEEDLAVVVGLRWGALVLETVQQFNNDASYGQLRIQSRYESGWQRDGTSVAIDAGFLLPDVRVTLTTRFGRLFARDDSSRWRRSAYVLARFGEPQLGQNPLLYTETTELGGGIEWQRRLPELDQRTSAYLALGAGLRREHLTGVAELEGERSKSVERGVALLAAGLRFGAAALAERWGLEIQLGVDVSVPFDDATVSVAGSSRQIQDTTVAMMLGVSFGYR